MTLFRVEVERALRRRIVRVLVAVALLGIAIIGTVVYVDSAGLALASDEGHPAVMADWWSGGNEDSILITSAVFLGMGALIGGASMFGAEWRAGTLPTLLVWEPRRGRLAVARIVASLLCAAVIAFLLQVVLLAALVPAVAAHGTTAGVDGAWWLDLAGAVLRIALLAAFAAAFAASLALATRHTAAAIVVAWAWLSVVETTLRGFKPWTGRFLISESIPRFVTWSDLPHGGRSPSVAALQLAVYIVGIASVAVWWFRRTDAVGT